MNSDSRTQTLMEVIIFLTHEKVCLDIELYSNKSVPREQNLGIYKQSLMRQLDGIGHRGSNTNQTFLTKQYSLYLFDYFINHFTY